MGEEIIMQPKAHGTSDAPVPDELRWGCDPNLADEICNFNREGSEPRLYFQTTRFIDEHAKTAKMDKALVQFCDSNTGQLVFSAPKGRSYEDFIEESRSHGWLSFRDSEVNWEIVRVLPGGEIVSVDGTHLGRLVTSKKENRYSINLVAVAGHPIEPEQKISFMARLFSTRRVSQLETLEKPQKGLPRLSYGCDWWCSNLALPQGPPADPDHHYIRQQNRIYEPFPECMEVASFAAGCFWSAEKGFWRLPGVYSTSVGFIGGKDSETNPTYISVCNGNTGHAAAVRVVWHPEEISFADLLRFFWSCHDPTQGHGQGMDRGLWYRSGIYVNDDRHGSAARASRASFDETLKALGYSSITTEIRSGCKFWPAEEYQQQYLAKRAPYNQYCSAEPTGAKLPPFEEWSWASSGKGRAHARSELTPQLSDAFWDVYDGSLRSSFAPAQRSATALAQAKAALEKRQEDFTDRTRTIERRYKVVIHYCGSCAYHRRANELAGHLQRTCGIEVGLLQDIRIAGTFELKAWRAEAEQWALVHSKSTGHGFVDTEEKLERIVRYIAGANPNGDAARNLDSVIKSCANFAGVVRARAAKDEEAKRQPSPRKTRQTPLPREEDVPSCPGTQATTIEFESAPADIGQARAATTSFAADAHHQLRCMWRRTLKCLAYSNDANVGWSCHEANIESSR